MTFSGALTLTDLNDFITPSQACIKPVEQSNPKLVTEQKEPGAASTEIHIDSAGLYYEVSADGLGGSSQAAKMNGTGSGRKLEQAQISLNDCLACSGCITSAESVLITLQSHREVFTFLESNNAEDSSSTYKVPIISIAPQSLASLAASLSSSLTLEIPVTPRQVLRRLRHFCKNTLGFSHVFDTTFARHLALVEHVHEFEERRGKDVAMKLKMGAGVEAQGDEDHQLPMLASACPGWICYAEKAHSEMLPFIARTKSPQQVMGTLVKTWMGQKWGKLPHEIYHVAVMPCYDKKLEASRQDFYNDVYATRDVDCVITTGELELMMQEKGWDLSVPVPGELDAPSSHDLDVDNPSSPTLPELISHPGTSSGSYLHALIAHLTSTSPTPLVLSVKQMRNADYEEYVLRRGPGSDGGEGEVVFKGAKCYGFRNLQNVVRKVGRERGVRTGSGAAGKLVGRANGGAKRVARRGVGAVAEEKEKGYDYVEVMACPGGCVNGGGQPKPPVGVAKDEEGYKRDWEESGVVEGGMQNAKWGDKEWTKKVEEAYWHDLPTPPATPPRRRLELPVKDAMDLLVGRILEEMCLSDGGLGDIDDGEEKDARRRMLLRTQYRAVESEVIGLAVKW